MRIENCEEFFTCLDIISEPENEGVAQTADTILKFVSDTIYRSGNPSLFLLDGLTYDIPHVFGFKAFSPLFETFNDMIGRLLAIGYFEKVIDLVYHNRKEIDVIDPQILTMDHLGLCFIACLIPLAVATLIFLAEFAVSFAKEAYIRKTHSLEHPDDKSFTTLKAKKTNNRKHIKAKP